MKNKNNNLSDMKDFFKDSQIEVKEEIYRRGRFTKNLSRYFMSVLSLSVIFCVFSVTFLSMIFVVAEPFITTWNSLPSKLGSVAISQRNTLYDKDGNVFAQVWNENRVELKSIKDINKTTINALIDTEDRRFYKNKLGFDFIGTLRAAVTGSGGGSGITQQLVKNLQFYNIENSESEQSAAVSKTLTRKIKELKLSIHYNETHSKKQILLNYFNTVAFGAPNIYSIESASQYFFDKPAKDLDLAQASALVGTANDPNIYNMNDETNIKWKDRQEIVLNNMVKQGHITKKQAMDAYNEQLVFAKKSSGGTCALSSYPFYCEYVMSYLANDTKLGSTSAERNAIINKGGLQIHTYLDQDAMKKANDYVKQNFGDTNRVVAPVAIVQPGTGGVQAIAVNRDYGTGAGQTTINVALNPTGSGSTYKMITLAAALKSGMTEEQLAFAAACPFRPKGYDYPEGGMTNAESCSSTSGYMDYQKATAYSVNTWFATLETKVGVLKVKELSKELNLSTPDNITSRSLSFTLGVTENSPVSMAAAFATFANDGVYCSPTPISSYSYGDGKNVPISDTYDPSTQGCKRVVSPKAAGIVLKAMRANTSGQYKDSTGYGRNIEGYDAVGKSGTNQLYNSVWEELSANYSIYVNVYDMNKLTNEVKTVWYKNSWWSWSKNAAGDTGYNIMKNILSGTTPISLDFDNQDNSLTPVSINTREFMTIPSVIGMQPAEALKVFKDLKMTSYVSKTYVDRPKNYPSGVIVKQSIKAGTKIAVGSKSKVILYISK